MGESYGAVHSKMACFMCGSAGGGNDKPLARKKRGMWVLRRRTALIHHPRPAGIYNAVSEEVNGSTRGMTTCLPLPLWGGAGAPGGTVRRAAVRKRGPGSVSLR